jgi:DNA-binding NarL/FixJ family response regulator
MQTQINEQSIIELIRQGKANKEIANEIKKSVSATENIIHRLLKKHNCKNRVELAVRGMSMSRE